MAAQHSPSKTPSRRALGDLTPRAINTPSKQTKTFMSSEAARAHSPVKPTQPPRMLAGKENVATPDALYKGRKRSINEVDGAESIEHAKMIARRRDAPLAPPHAGMPLTAAAVQQQQQQQQQQQHYSDNIPVALVPGSPTERNTPTPERDLEPIPDSQTSNQSFSDFVNYGLCTSQKSQHEAPPTSTPSVIPQAASSPPAQGKKSRAQLLRTRLNFATYKVKTNQISKRGADIISTWEIHTSSSPDAPAASMLASFAESAHRVPDITVSSPRRDPVFVKANLDPFRPVSALGPAPVQFQPPTEAAPVSSRMIHDYHTGPGSSPPAALPQSVSPEQLISSRTGYTTPASKRIHRHYGQDAGAGAEGRESKHDRLQRLKGRAYEDSDLANNAVKGNAAKGLMELMSGRR